MSGEIINSSLKLLSVTDAHVAPGAGITRTKMALNPLQIFGIPLSLLRKDTDESVTLPATAAASYLGLYTGTYGSGQTLARTEDVKSLGAQTRRARVTWALDDRYPAGGGVSLRAVAGMKTTVADTSATILLEAYRLDPDGVTIGSNLTSGTPVTINSLTLAAKDFPVTSAGLAPGDRLDIRVSFVITDAAGVTAVIGVLHSLFLRSDVN